MGEELNKATSQTFSVLFPHDHINALKAELLSMAERNLHNNTSTVTEDGI